MSDSLCRSWDSPKGMPATGSVGWGGVSWGQVGAEGSTEFRKSVFLSSKQIASGKGSSLSIYTAADLRGDGRLGQMAQARDVRPGWQIRG